MRSLNYFPLLLCAFSLVSTFSNGFQARLTHRDSPTSPFYNPNHTKTERIQRAVNRTMKRITHFQKKPNNSFAEITTDSGEYLLNIAIGTPPVEIIAIADTGSDLVWTQCKPCESCFPQKAPLFDPAASTTYSAVGCESTTCTEFESGGCETNGGPCQYSVEYGDNSFTQGSLSVDVIKLGNYSIPRAVFGCGHDNDGTFNQNGSGIVGLGGGLFSAARQFNAFMNSKFSYCLRPWMEEGDSSPMYFGDEAVISGKGKVSTPMVSKNPKTFYFLTLKGITVDGRGGGGRKEEVEEGNIVIDSGTTVTVLPSEMYSELEEGVMEKIKLERAEDPDGRLPLCYRGNMSSFDAPNITAHFDGAEVHLGAVNTFFQYSKGVLCLAFVPGGSNGVAIFGNLAQINMEVGYNLDEMTVSFKPTNCSQF